MNPLISVIIPVFNVQEYLEKCLKSLVNQSIGVENLEIIIVNDGSTDDSMRIIQNYKKKYPSITVLEQTNRGVAAARNRALKSVTGKYIAFLDSDDYLPEDAYEKLYNSSENEEMDIVSGKIIYEYKDRKEVRESNIFNLDCDEIIVDLKVSRKYWDLIRHGMACYRIYRRDLIVGNNIQFVEGLCYEDIYFNTCANLLADKIKIINETVYFYVRREGSITHGNKKYLFLDMFKVIDKTMDLIIGKNLKDYRYIFDTVVLETLLTVEGRLYKYIERTCIDLYSLSPIEFEEIGRILLKYLAGVRKETICNLPEKLRVLYTDLLERLQAKDGQLCEYHQNSNEKSLTPLISVIVPVYKVENYIEACLQSLATQTLKNIEVIVVNDGSPDNSGQIASDFIRNYSNFKLFNKSNGGLGDARNYGVVRSTGKYILFVDSDDMLTPRACELLYNKANETNSDITIGKPSWRRASGLIEPIEYLEQWFKGDLDQNYRDNPRIAIGFPTAYPKLYLSSLIIENGLKFPHIIGEDVPFSVQSFFYATKISLINNTVYLRTEREDEVNKSITQTFDFRTVNDRINGLRMIDEFCEEFALDSIRGQNLNIIGYINSLFLKIDDKEQQKLAFISIKDYLTSIKNENLIYLVEQNLNVPFQILRNMNIEEYIRNLTSFKKSMVKPRHKISIIIPVYNVEAYISEALKSIERQTIGLENLEVIMVNDGSSDNSGAIMDEFAKKHPNFFAIHLDEKSGAAGKPRNIGMQKATGDYFMFLDPDDYFDDQACEILYKEIVKYNCDISMGTFKSFNQNGSRQGSWFFRKIKEDSKFFDDINKFKQLLTAPPAVWSKMFRSAFVKENNIVFPEKIAGQDLAFSTHCFLVAKGIAFTQKNVCNYRIRDGEDKSISFNCDMNYFKGINQAQEYVYNLFKVYEREEDYSYIVNEGVLNYYLSRINNSQVLSTDDKIQVYQLMQWLFKKSVEYEIKPQEVLYIPVVNKIVDGEFYEAVVIGDLYKQIIDLQRSTSLNEIKSKLGIETTKVTDYAERELQRIYNMRTWRLLQRYRRFMDNSKLGFRMSKIRNRLFKRLNF